MAETLAAFAADRRSGARRCGDAGPRGTFRTVWGCPYEGEIDPARAVGIARKLLEMGCYQVSLGDTIGVGTPRQTARILERMSAEIGRLARLAMHMHDTRGTALANVLTGLEMGIRDFDASVGGMGGCPYAPGAAVHPGDRRSRLHAARGWGSRPGIDLERLVEAGRVAEHRRPAPSLAKVHQAGVRSPVPSALRPRQTFGEGPCAALRHACRVVSPSATSPHSSAGGRLHAGILFRSV